MIKFSDEYWMQLALEQAQFASAYCEVPVGAVLVKNDKLIASGFNQPISSHDPTAHAEVVALRNAAQTLNNYRLPDSTLYVTIEPCTMCVGALVHARISRVVFGAPEPKAGALISADQLMNKPHFNHQFEFVGGVLADECSELMSSFFRNKRLSK